MKNIAAYIRVSSDKQDVTRQRESINDWSRRNSTPIEHWFEDAEGRNPRDQAHKRQGFQKLLKAVEAGLISCIVVDRQDRFGARDAYQWGAFLTLLRDNGCSLVEASTGKDLSADDEVAILTGTLGAITSTREQKEKAHRNVSGKLPKARRGEYQGGNPPYGFDVVCFGADGQEKWRTVYVGHYRRWKVYPDGQREQFDGKDNSPRKDPTDTFYLRPTVEKARLSTVTKIFQWYAHEALSPTQIATRLNKLGISPVFGEHWHKVTIRQLLQNPAYIGLPTWNKKGGSRFVEYVNGQIRPVERENGKLVLGRQRDAKDFIQPDRSLFKPIIDRETWDAVQAKFVRASGKKKRSAQTDELWLKPFLYCGHCCKPMRSTMGRSTKGLFPSYFCGTYGTYGRDNPAGCRCNRVKHDLLERIVSESLDKMGFKIDTFLNAIKDDDLDVLKPLLQKVEGLKEPLTNLWMSVYRRIEKVGVKRDESLVEVHAREFEQQRPQIENAIADKEAELDRMLTGYADLTGGLRERANAKMQALQQEIVALRESLENEFQLFGKMWQELQDRKVAVEQAKQLLSKGGEARRKGEALSHVVDRIDCHFTHTELNGSKYHGKSYLKELTITPASGEAVNFTVGITPGRNYLRKALYRVYSRSEIEPIYRVSLFREDDRFFEDRFLGVAQAAEGYCRILWPDTYADKDSFAAVLPQILSVLDELKSPTLSSKAKTSLIYQNEFSLRDRLLKLFEREPWLLPILGKDAGDTPKGMCDVCCTRYY